MQQCGTRFGRGRFAVPVRHPFSLASGRFLEKHMIRFTTNMGVIDIELDHERAPLTSRAS